MVKRECIAMIVGLSLFLGLLCFENVFASVVINEIEMNPAGSSDNGKEWIELYSDNPINITNWQLRSINGRNMTFNASILDYYTVFTPYQLLTDTDQTLFIYNGSDLIFQTISINDAYNDDRTWQYCSAFGNWTFTNSTKNSLNNCSYFENQNSNNNESNNDEAEDTLENENSLNKSKDVYIELEWNEEDIVTWDEFEMTIRAFNLKDYNYDVKAYIELDDGTTISERYDEDRGWVSGVYFFNGFFSGNGNKSNKLRMQIKKDYENFSGDANIFGKIRKNDKILYEIEDEIVIIGKNKTQKTSTDTYVSSNSASDNANLQTESDSSGSVIDLRSKNANINKNTANSIIYKSRTEYIKEYAYYAFGLLCLLLIIVYIISRIKRKKK